MSGLHEATPDHLEHLRTVPFFRSLPTGELVRIAGLCKRLDLPADCNVFYEGDRGDAMFALITGEVSVYKTSSDGTDVEITRLAAGNVFGHFALLDRCPRSASVKVTSGAILLELRQRDFQALVRDNREILWNILGGLAAILSECRMARSNGGEFAAAR